MLLALVLAGRVDLLCRLAARGFHLALFLARRAARECRAPLYVWIVGPVPLRGPIHRLSVMMWIMHRSNIARLASGQETRIGKR